MHQTVVERLRRLGDGDVEDARASDLPPAAVQATARHVHGGECAGMAQAEAAIARAANAVRAMMRAVRDAGGLGSELHERLGSALVYLTAPVRAHAAAEAWEAYHAIVAGDLPNVDWPAIGGTSMEQIKQAREQLAGSLAPLAIAVGGQCEDMRRQWREAA